jgi:hypothetical protein
MFDGTLGGDRKRLGIRIPIAVCTIVWDKSIASLAARLPADLE